MVEELLQTNAQQWNVSSAVLTQQTQNAVLARKVDKDTESISSVPSVFGNLPSAKKEETAAFAATLAACFPQMPSTFWGFVAKYADAHCLSKA